MDCGYFYRVAGEMLISDLSRRGCIDGMTLRFPTITVRAGVPSGASSSFVSDIVREVYGKKRREKNNEVL